MNYAKIAAIGKPDFSSRGANIDIALFVPGVSTSLLVILVFGTTKSPKTYWDFLFCCGGRRNEAPKRSMRRRTAVTLKDPVGTSSEFDRLPSVPSSPAYPTLLSEQVKSTWFLNTVPVQDVELRPVDVQKTRNLSLPSPRPLLPDRLHSARQSVG